MTRAGDQVVIYEPNALNPYGAEVARVIAASARGSVRLVVRRDSELRDLGDVVLDDRLESASTGTGLARRVLARVAGPVSVAVLAGAAPLVVIWTRDAWDSFVFRVRAALGRPVVVVHHNPVEGRERPGLAGLAERRMRRAATVVASHSPELAAKSRATTDRPIVVAPHPAYSGLVASLRSASSVARAPHERIQVAIVGGLRADKGADLLPAIAAASIAGWDLLVLGPDRFAPDVEQALHKSDVHVIYPDQQPVTDEQLVAGMRRSDLVLAPYTQMTESGSVILAITVGVPVLGLDSPGLRRLLLDRSCAATPEDLGRLIEAFRIEPWETHRLTAEQLDGASIAGWRSALAAASTWRHA